MHAARKNAFLLPDTDGAETAGSGNTPTRHGPARAGNVQHARLLVVTPDAGAADALRTRLVLAGYGVDWARDAERAVAAAEAQAPDLALVAAAGTGGRGGDPTASLVSALKAACDGAYLPVVLLTATPAQAEGDWTASGADDALAMTAGDALLRVRVKALLHLKRRHQALADSLSETQATCDAAQQAAARYGAVFQQNTEAMLLVSPDGGIAEANLCAFALSGFEPEGLVELPLARLCPPELCWAAQATAPLPLCSFTDLHASLMTASGEAIPIEVRAVPVDLAAARVQDADAGPGSAGLLLVTLKDRRPEQARLARAQSAASSETALALSRELNNPLFVISSNIELLQNALMPQDSGVQARLGRIADAGRRLLQAAARASAPPAPAPPKE